MAPSIVSDDEFKTVIRNDDGDWTIRKSFAAGTDQAGPGPGYIAKFVRPNGTIIVDDPFTPDGTINDPRFGGLGCFGFHAARINGWYPSTPENYTWDVTGRHHAPTRFGFGADDAIILTPPQAKTVSGGAAIVFDLSVDFYDGEAWASYEPLLTVNYEYVVWASRIRCLATVMTRLGSSLDSPAFIKEPKFVCHGLGVASEGSPEYRYLDMFRADGSLIEHFDIWSLPDPNVKTKQWGYDTRCRARFDDPAKGHLYFNIVARALAPDGSRDDWEGSNYGLDKWAQLANGRERLEPCEANEAYCLQGPGDTLTRQWETARWSVSGAGSSPEPGRPQTGIMLHAWEGGSGYPDCRCAFRRYGALGEQFQVYLCYSYDAGWIV